MNNNKYISYLNLVSHGNIAIDPQITQCLINIFFKYFGNSFSSWYCKRMSIKLLRNENYQPIIDKEGFFESTGLPVPPNYQDSDEKLWYENLKICERIYYHNTLSSARRHTNFHNCK